MQIARDCPDSTPRQRIDAMLILDGGWITLIHEGEELCRVARCHTDPFVEPDAICRSPSESLELLHLVHVRLTMRRPALSGSLHADNWCGHRDLS